MMRPVRRLSVVPILAALGLVPGLVGADIGSLSPGRALAATNSACPTAASSTAASCTYSSTGSEQTFAVPAGVTAVTITAVGAPGAPGYSFSSGPGSGGVGGSGATVTATVPVTAGISTLFVEVGGTGASGGFNGGSSGVDLGGGVGGGASDVRTCSAGTCPLSTNDTRLVVAGGGGGGGGYGPNSGAAGPGGQAGDTTATGAGAGGNGFFYGCSAAGNGGFGSPAGPGGIFVGLPTDESGSAGSLGQGGSGSGYAGGGGGGGGYDGGGGGGGTVEPDHGELGCGGGAGSSYWVSGATGTSMTEDTTGTPQVTISYTLPVDLSLTNTAPVTVVSGKSLTYTLTATNTGGAGASSVHVTDNLPTSAHFVSMTATQGTCTRTAGGIPKTKDGAVACSLGTLAGGTSATITIVVTPTIKGSISAVAGVTASNVTGDTDDNATATTTVTGT